MRYWFKEKIRSREKTRPLRQGSFRLEYSLGRIDSSGHYERRNLQVVYKFINQWKGATANEEFKRLIALVRG